VAGLTGWQLHYCAVNVQKDVLAELKTQIKVFIAFNE